MSTHSGLFHIENIDYIITYTKTSTKIYLLLILKRFDHAKHTCNMRLRLALNSLFIRFFLLSAWVVSVAAALSVIKCLEVGKR